MSPVDRRLAVDVIRLDLGLAAVVAALVILVDGVEHVGLLADGGVAQWAVRVLAEVPGQVLAALPVAGALASGVVAAAWRRRGRLVASSSCGRSPASLAVVAGVAVLGTSLAITAAREVVAPWVAAHQVVHGRWVELPGPLPEGLERGRVLVHAERLTEQEAVAVRIAWTRAGRLVGHGTVDQARWRDGRWELAGASASLWVSGQSVPTEARLPEPRAWRRQGMGASPEAPLGVLWRGEPSPARSTWIWERLVSPLGAGLVGALAWPLVLGVRRWGQVPVVVSALTWRLLQGGALVVAARGVWPVWTGTALPVVLLGVVVAGAVGWIHRRPVGRYSATTQ